jgi:hypothetical protein
MSPRRVLRRGLALGLAALLAPGAAAASACCLSSAFGTGRLAVWEQGAAGLTLSATPLAGRWGPDGAWVGRGEGSELALGAAAWGAVRLHERLELGARLPWVGLRRSTGTLAEQGGGVGDAALSLRWTALGVGARSPLPGIALTAGLRAPTGRATRDSRTVLGTDVTGQGAWAPSVGLSLERSRTRWFVRLDAGLGVPLASEGPFPGSRQRGGPVLDVALGGGLEVRRNLVLGLTPRLSLEGPRTLDGAAVPGSGSRLLALELSAAYKLAARWSLQAAAESSAPVDGLGRNRPSGHAFTLGVRHAVF